MARAFNYTIIPNDPFSVAQAINDLASRIVDEGVLLAEYILADGSRGLSAAWNAGAFAITAKNFISSAATGTSPYACTSTTLNTNLNADLLDGQHGSYYATASGYVPYTGATGAVNLGVFGLTAASITNTGLTITRVPYVSTGGLLADSSALTFNSGTGALSATSFSGGNVTSGADPGHTHSAYLTAETDDLASVVARGATTTNSITIGNTLTIGDGTAGNKTITFDGSADTSMIWDGTNILYTAPILTTAKFRSTTNVLVGALTYPAKIEYASSETYKIAAEFKAGASFDCWFDAANYNGSIVAGTIIFNKATGIPAGANNSFIGLYGGTGLAVSPGALKYIADGLQFAVYNNADLAAGTGKINIDYIHRGVNVTSQMGYNGKIISGKANCLNYGITVSATLEGTFNSTVASVNYGGYFSTVDNLTDMASGSAITSYGCYIAACASSTKASLGVLTSWGLYEVNGRNNALLGPVSIGKLTAPTVPLDVVGAILNTTTIEAGTGFRCGGTAAVADGTYTTGIGGTTNGTITVKGGIITAVQQAVA